MSATTIPLSRRSKALQTILWAGLIAGVLDLAAACAVSWLRGGVTPFAVFNYIASGIYGRGAFGGGTMMAVQGVALHFIIATIWAAVYYLASRRLKFLVTQTITSGVLYGVVVYLFMNFVVIPLSAVARRPVPLSGQIIGVLIIIFCIGLPIAFIVRRFSK